MADVESFTKWALAQGVTLNGIVALRRPGRGVGFIAERRIEAGEEILRAPIPALRTELTVPKTISKPLLGSAMSVNGLIALDLALGEDAVTADILTAPLPAPWRAILPSPSSFQSMPMRWPPALQALLPPAAHALLTKQQTKFATDFALASSSFPSLAEDNFLYHWLLVSTRTFFFTSPKVKRKPLVRDDCLALVPLADLFNHAAEGCEVSFSPAAYSVNAHRDIEEGAEVCISYGAHSNDFLLVEYGFVMGGAGEDDEGERNTWDAVELDGLLAPLMGEEQEEVLREEGFWGRYVLDAEGVCYRTRVALGALCMPVGEWRQALKGGFEEGDKKRKKKSDGILLQALTPYRDVVQEKIETVEALDVEVESQRETLSRRWKQIHSLVSEEINRIETR